MTGSIHVFRCGELDLYGLTRDPAGANLPREAAGDWRLVRSFDITSDPPQWGVDVTWQEKTAAVDAGLLLNGFFLSEGAGLPPELLEPQELQRSRPS